MVSVKDERGKLHVVGAHFLKCVLRSPGVACQLGKLKIQLAADWIATNRRSRDVWDSRAMGTAWNGSIAAGNAQPRSMKLYFRTASGFVPPEAAIAE